MESPPSFKDFNAVALEIRPKDFNAVALEIRPKVDYIVEKVFK